MPDAAAAFSFAASIIFGSCRQRHFAAAAAVFDAAIIFAASFASAAFQHADFAASFRRRLLILRFQYLRLIDY